jgi:hypothetical protein
MKDWETDVPAKLAEVMFMRRFVKWGMIAEGPDYQEALKEVTKEIRQIMKVSFEDGQHDRR